MVNIVNGLRENRVKNIRFFLNYPIIELENENEEVNRFVKIVNKLI